MTDVLITAEELSFLLWDWLQVGALLDRAGAEGHDRATVEAVLDLSAELAARTFLPHYKEADQHEPSVDAAGQVHVLPAIGKALREYASLGLPGAGFAPALGGMGLPAVVVSASLAQFMAASLATSAYPMLTMGNARLIATFGSAALVEAFARPQIEGGALGTMCLSEPQAGSGLGDIRTRAAPDGEDALGQRYRLIGNKMWISGGDHDITRDIVHLVLAKVPGPDGALQEGTRGISLFAVPKWMPGGEERNDVAVAGLNHKMGYRGTANCLLNFGEGRHRPMGAPGAVGWLVGEEGRGLQFMFHMMNEARINVGLGAAAMGVRGYRHALAYARERVQGRALAGAAGDGPVAIIEHPDVQRMLLAQKAYAEGALALVLYCSKLVDEEEGDAAAELLALLTPVAKTWPSEWGLAANDLAIQVHGGYGYTRDFDVEQLYRDNRLNPIHEGTTGIQALDLLGRKVLRGGDAGLDELGRRLKLTAERAAGHEALAGWSAALLQAWGALRGTVDVLRAADAPRALANATAFLRAFGHIVVAWVWLDLAFAATTREAVDSDFAAGKRRACRFFFECELPHALTWLSFARALSDVASGVPLAQF